MICKIVFVVAFLLCSSFLVANENKLKEPTAEETLSLEYVNRFRMNPANEAKWFLAKLKSTVDFKDPQISHSYFYLFYTKEKHFRTKPLDIIIKSLADRKPLGPLAFNLDLIAASRSHVHFVRKNKYFGGSELVNKEGFTGVTYADRAIAKGYKSKVIEGYGFYSKKSPLDLHLNFMSYLGANRSSSSFGRLTNIYLPNKIHNEIGIGISKRNSRYGVRMIADYTMGIKKPANRFLCGVIYFDKNLNNFYDVGEGIKDVEIKISGGNSTKSWTSGAYSLRLQNFEPAKVVLTHAGLSKTVSIEKGPLNVKVDWLVGEAKLVKSQLALLEAYKKDSTLKSIIELYLNIKRNGYALDTKNNDICKEIVGKVQLEFESQITALLKLIANNELKELSKLIANIKSKYIGSNVSVFLEEASLLEHYLTLTVAIKATLTKNGKPHYNSNLIDQWKGELKKINEIKLKFKGSLFNEYWISIQSKMNGFIYGPTNGETLTLEYINRLRIQPKKEAKLIYDLYHEDKRLISSKLFRNAYVFDIEMFKKEVEIVKPCAPIFFDLNLQRSAKSHSNYMILNNIQAHFELKKYLGFTGKSPRDRGQAAEYKGYVAENIFLNATSPLNGHIGFVVDWGHDKHGVVGAGGMQPKRGHRVNMINPRHKVVGVASISWSSRKRDRVSVTHNFGRIKRTNRYIGGVIYQDQNKNKFYDIGEGVGDVSIRSSDGREAESWSSGAYTLLLKSGEAVTIIMEHAGVKKHIQLKKGFDNVKLDWIVVDKVIVNQQRKLLELLKVKITTSAQIKLILHVEEHGKVLGLDENQLTVKLTYQLSKEYHEMLTDLKDHLVTKSTKALKSQLIKYKSKFNVPELQKLFTELYKFATLSKKLSTLQKKRKGSTSPKYRRQLSKRAKVELSKCQRVFDHLQSKEFKSYWKQLLSDIKVEIKKGSDK